MTSDWTSLLHGASFCGALLTLAALLLWYARWKPEQVKSAREALRALPRHEPAPIIEVLKSEVRKYHRRRIIIEPLEAISRIALLTFPLVVWFGRGLSELAGLGELIQFALPWLIGIVVGFGFGFVGRTFGPSPLHRMAMERLLEMGGPYVLAALVEGLGVEDAAMRAVSEETLTLRLPHLKTHDADHLTVEHMAILNRHLEPDRVNRNPQLTVAIMKAMEQIGDETSLAALVKLASSDRVPEYVQRAAFECIDYVRNRIDSQADARSLMRASSVPGDPKERLLRPVAGPSTTDETLLVRPFEEGE